jgi:hypothetical protein
VTVTGSPARYRRFLRLHVLPWVLGALVLRAMIPMGFMPAQGTTLGTVMCSTQGPLTEEIGIPGSAATMQCDYCLMPALDAAPASIAAASIAPVADTPPASYESPAFPFALERAQGARAPPV